MNEPLLKVEHLKKNFPIRGGVFSKQIGAVKAVDDISFTIHKGETLGLVVKAAVENQRQEECSYAFLNQVKAKLFLKATILRNYQIVN